MNDFVKSIVKFSEELIKIPSQGGIDSSQPVLELIQAWLSCEDLSSKLLYSSEKKPVGVLCSLKGEKSGPLYCLTACADTAPFGDIESWEFSPISARIKNGWLYGRGSADSKVAVAIFCHLALTLKDKLDRINGSISFYFDGDEHSGSFGGIKAYIKENPKTKGVFIGYPGNEAICSGCRGFYRAQLTTYAIATHSGTLKASKGNAVEKAGRLIDYLGRLQLEKEVDETFGLPAKLSITQVCGGQGYSIVPDKCDIKIDVRLTPLLNSEKVSRIITSIVDQVDEEYPTIRSTQVQEIEGYPAYKLPENSQILNSLIKAASKYLKKSIDTRICGPSNVGNYLAKHGIEATCGFGLSYKNIHGANECIDISTIESTYEVYRDAVETLVMLK